MQIYNKSQSNYDARRKRVVIGIISCVVLVVAGVFVATTLIPTHSRPERADQNHATTFDGASSFIDSGLSIDQVNGLIKAFSKYASSANAVVVDRKSLVPGPHNPKSSDPTFTINFNVSIDSIPYTGKVTYSGLNTIRLFLFAKDSKLVFDSGE